MSTTSITIVVPHEGSARQTPIWAFEEDTIDFRRDPERACRCTTAFAAVELRDHLRKTLIGAEVVFSPTRPARGPYIELAVERPGSVDETFALVPEGEGVRVQAVGRAGVLHGAWELLRLQGWRWYAPRAAGTVTPAPRAALALPATATRHTPSFGYGRGFDFAWVSQESADLWLWMARNRMTVSTYRPSTGQLGRKLGMSFQVGGHIFEKILDPDRLLPDGRTLWETHQDWFGLPAGGLREKDKAQRVQFCVSRPDLLEFLGQELLVTINGPWSQADRVGIWGFDTWGSTCGCADCVRLGNGSDHMLHLLASLRGTLDRARAAGTLDHEVVLAGCAYEGTCTLSGPTRPPPEALLDGRTTITYYPINRCYEHDLDDSACAVNVPYARALGEWLAPPTSRIPLVLGEYYNVSKFEDLPALFTKRMRHDTPLVRKLGAAGVTYMHVPFVSWGVRTITQCLHAQLSWDAATDVRAWLTEYFDLWYGPHAAALRSVYEDVEEAWRSIADWRCWARRSVLSQLLAWDGGKPTAALPAGTHWADAARTVADGRRSIGLMRQALGALEGAMSAERLRAARIDVGPLAPASGPIVNPIQAKALEEAGAYEARMADDRRGLIYGHDTLVLMTEMVAYHDALRRADTAAADEAWTAAATAADTLDRYSVPLSWEWPGAGMEALDGLTRTQLRPVLARCRAARSRAAEGD